MTPRWRLFPKYALLIIALVGGLLIASGATSIYFSWRENEQNLIALQAEKAQAAAARIEQYILDIEHQLGWTTLPALEEGADPFEPRRTEYQKLFRLVPQITEVAWLDPTGHEQVRISRVAVNVDGSNDDYSQAAKFKVAKGGTTFYGPVYFRKETEPYMTIARPAGLGGGVTAAEVNLKFVWDVVSRIRIGEKGAAYVVDDDGVLIAHPDISLVLRKTDLNSLPQVAALKQPDASARPPARGIGGAPVLSAHAAIPTLRWTVFVESPEAEAFAPLYASILRAGLLLGAGLLVSMVASFFVARALVRPLRELQEGAARIGAGELDRRIDVRTGDELEGLAEQFNKMAGDLKESYSGLERKVEQRTAELSEALEQQTATAEILHVISSSPTDVQPVFEAIAERAMTLCEARVGGVARFDGEWVHLVAYHGVSEEANEAMRAAFPMKLGRGAVTARAILERAPVQIEDVLADPEYTLKDATRKAGFRSNLGVPMMREGEVIGSIAVCRAEPGVFPERLVRLLQTFANQAVIAIENVRLFNETKEALDRQTATAEILRVISGSITDTQPVFEAIVQSCRRLFGGKAVYLAMARGDMIENVAFAADASAPKGIGFLKPWLLDRGSGAGTCILDARVVIVADTMEAAKQFPRMHDLAIALGYRSCLFVPLLKDGRALGTITILREATGAFHDQEIALAQTFADQAVIAIENVRLFNETNEALERQTATAEVLKVISASPTDVEPVLQAVAERAGLLCKAEGSRVWLLVASDKLRAMTAYGPIGGEDELPLRRSSIVGRAFLERRLLHIDDVVPLIETEYPDVRAMQTRLGFRTVLAVPMLRDGQPIGVITLLRRWVQPFLEADVSLVQTFADQAVIAIENTRMFNETKEALERQTATAEILKVIAASPDDVQPVFDAIAASSNRLLGGRSTAVWRFRDDAMHLVGFTPTTPEGDAALLELSGTALERFQFGHRIVAGETVRVTDTEDVAQSAVGAREVARARGFRSMVITPLRRDNASIGMLSVTRREPGEFTPHQIELLQTFADQAVIAIENVRLFNETKEALERQTATAEILRVISSSPNDVQPVFDAIAKRARMLCSADSSAVRLPEGESLRVRARDLSERAMALRTGGLEIVPTSRTSVTGRAFLEARTIHIEDVQTEIDAEYPAVRDMVRKNNFRTMLVVPMLREGRSIGTLSLFRYVVRPFSATEIGLVKTFADQAVIAIENVRLFNETKEALQQQTATAEVLQVISSSVADAAPVFEKILESCDHLFASNEQGILLIGDDGRVNLAAHHGHVRERLERMFPSAQTGDFQTLLLERGALHFKDVLADPDVPPGIRAIADQLGIGSYSQVFAPMLWKGRAIGTLYVTRQPPTGFSDKEVELLRTFAEQAVIAIQNARLFNETKEALEQQTATSAVLQVISSSVADTQPVFDKILDSCERLFAANGLGIYLIDDADMLHLGAFRGNSLGLPGPARAVAGVFPRPLEGTATALAVRGRRVVHFADVLGDPEAPLPLRRIAEVTGNFSIAFAPMLWEDRGVGAIQVSRDPPNPFSDKELTLLKTFADQAVIAIQNARLFNEIQAKSRELEMANKHKSEFLANMSHELRTPLNAIIGFSEVLSEKMFGEVNDKQLEYLLDIHSSGHHLLTLINDILDLSKIEAGRMELDLARVDLPMLLDNCTTLVRERASRQGLVLALDVGPGVGEWVADVRKLKQIVINLLANAVKFTPAGGRVTLRAVQFEHAVEIAVVDTGVGIAPDQQALVFEEFRQAGGDYLRKGEGTGLGLSLSKRFVELHGGSIRVESAPGRGSTFAFVLPERTLETV